MSAVTHEVVDFGPGPLDDTRGYPFAGSESECSAWLAQNQETRPTGESRYAMQEIPEES